MSINLILKNLPQRFPFLMCDCIEEYAYQSHSKGYKNVSIGEPYFTGHFPDEPIMPGVLVLETMAQIGGFVFLNENDSTNGLRGYIAGFNNVKFSRQVLPGNRLDVNATFVSQLGSLGKVKAVASVNGTRVANAEVIYKFERNQS